MLDDKTSIFSFAQLKSFFFDLLLGLSFLQTLEIAHRDLKPANLLLEEQLDGIMRIKILDYGLSRILAIEDDEVSRIEAPVEGNKLYMSPELYIALECNQELTVLNPFKSDVFSFGLICLEIGSRQIIKKKAGLDKLKERIQINMTKMRENYSHLVDKEKKEFEEIMGMIERSLDFDTKTRPDFLKLLKEKINLKKKQEKTLISIFIEQMTNEETKEFIDFALAWKAKKTDNDPKTMKKLWLEEKKQWKLIKEKEKLQVMFLLIFDYKNSVSNIENLYMVIFFSLIYRWIVSQKFLRTALRKKLFSNTPNSLNFYKFLVIYFNQKFDSEFFSGFYEIISS